MGCLVDWHCHFSHHQHRHQCHQPLFSYNVFREPTPHCKLRIRSLFTILVSMVSERKETFFLVRNHPLLLFTWPFTTVLVLASGGCMTALGNCIRLGKYKKKMSLQVNNKCNIDSLKAHSNIDFF